MGDRRTFQKQIEVSAEKKAADLREKAEAALNEALTHEPIDHQRIAAAIRRARAAGSLRRWSSTRPTRTTS